MLVYDWTPNILRSVHIYLDKDLGIFDLRKPCFEDSHYLLHTQVYIPCKGLLDILDNRRKFRYRNEH